MKVAEGDFINVRKSMKVRNKVLIDYSKSKKAHRDFIQLIPSSRKHGRWQYLGGLLKDVEVSNCVLLAKHKESAIQAVFASDGLFQDIVVMNNLIHNPGSAHAISFCGLLSGVIKNNTDLDDKPSKVKLYPMRIGGGLGKNIWVMTFKDKSLKYKKIKNIRNDYRFKPHNDKDIFLYNFDLAGFQKEAVKNKEQDIKKFIKEIKKLALKFGGRV